MNLNCPHCDKEIDVTDKLPPYACDEEEHECECGCVFEFGWYAEVEVRNVIEKPNPINNTESKGI